MGPDLAKHYSCFSLASIMDMDEDDAQTCGVSLNERIFCCSRLSVAKECKKRIFHSQIFSCVSLVLRKFIEHAIVVFVFLMVDEVVRPPTLV